MNSGSATVVTSRRTPPWRSPSAPRSRCAPSAPGLSGDGRAGRGSHALEPPASHGTSSRTVAARFSIASLSKRAADEWLLFGDPV